MSDKLKPLIWREPCEHDEQQYLDWLEKRPYDIKELGLKYRPWHIYRITETKQLCSIYSFYHDNENRPTIRVTVIHDIDYRPVHRVFGLHEEDIEGMYELA